MNKYEMRWQSLKPQTPVKTQTNNKQWQLTPTTYKVKTIKVIRNKNKTKKC